VTTLVMTWSGLFTVTVRPGTLTVCVLPACSTIREDVIVLTMVLAGACTVDVLATVASRPG